MPKPYTSTVELIEQLASTPCPHAAYRQAKRRGLSRRRQSGVIIITHRRGR